MLMIRENFPDGGGFRLRHITRACLPDGPLPTEGRFLTSEQINDAMSLANHAMSRRREIGKAEYDLGRVALEHGPRQVQRSRPSTCRGSQAGLSG